MDKPNVFDLLSSVFAKAGVTPILIGGFAVNAHRVTRHTIDIDFMIVEDTYGRVRDLLQAEGFLEVVREKNFSRLKPNAHAGLLYVDFLFVDEETFGVIQKNGKKIHMLGQDFLIPSVEHLISMKIHAIKQQPDLRELKDLPDVVGLIRSNHINVRADDFRALCLKFGTQELYEKILHYSGGNA